LVAALYKILFGKEAQFGSDAINELLVNRCKQNNTMATRSVEHPGRKEGAKKLPFDRN
jgi:hypothetical protein